MFAKAYYHSTVVHSMQIYRLSRKYLQCFSFHSSVGLQ